MVFLFLQNDLSNGFCNRNAKGDVAVQDRNAYLNFRNLALKDSCHEALFKQLHAMHFCLDATPAAVAVPVPLECPTQIF